MGTKALLVFPRGHAKPRTCPDEYPLTKTRLAPLVNLQDPALRAPAEYVLSG